MSAEPRSDRAPAGSPQDLVRVLEEQGIRDPRVLDAFGRVRRDRFLPGSDVGRAYQDRPIPIPHGQVTTQPSLVARMVEALHLAGDERVLEVGTGLGYQTAILRTLARQVYSIERFPDLANAARANLAAVGIEDVLVVTGDGTLGLPRHGPFDGIIVSAAAPEVPSPLVDQLADGGRLVHPIGPGGNEMVVAFRKQRGRLVEKAALVPALFVRLIGEHGLPED